MEQRRLTLGCGLLELHLGEGRVNRDDPLSIWTGPVRLWTDISFADGRPPRASVYQAKSGALGIYTSDTRSTHDD